MMKYSVFLLISCIVFPIVSPWIGTYTILHPPNATTLLEHPINDGDPLFLFTPYINSTFFQFSFNTQYEGSPPWPVELKKKNWFVVRFEGSFFVSSESPYDTFCNFTFGGDDGVDLWVDGNHIDSLWSFKAYSTITKGTSLKNGEHNFTLLYFQAAWGAQVSFSVGPCSPNANITLSNGTILANYWFLEMQDFNPSSIQVHNDTIPYGNYTNFPIQMWVHWEGQIFSPNKTANLSVITDSHGGIQVYINKVLALARGFHYDGENMNTSVVPNGYSTVEVDFYCWQFCSQPVSFFWIIDNQKIPLVEEDFLPLIPAPDPNPEVVPEPEFVPEPVPEPEVVPEPAAVTGGLLVVSQNRNLTGYFDFDITVLNSSTVLLDGELISGQLIMSDASLICNGSVIMGSLVMTLGSVIRATDCITISEHLNIELSQQKLIPSTTTLITSKCIQGNFTVSTDTDILQKKCLSYSTFHNSTILSITFISSACDPSPFSIFGWEMWASLLFICFWALLVISSIIAAILLLFKPFQKRVAPFRMTKRNFSD